MRVIINKRSKKKKEKKSKRDISRNSAGEIERVIKRRAGNNLSSLSLWIACKCGKKKRGKKRKKEKSPTKGHQVSRSGDQILEKAEEIPLLLRTAGTCNLRSWCHGHWADNVLIPHFGELVVVM